MNIFYYDVAIPIPIRETFTYECKESIQVGSRVLVEFRKKKVVGHIVKAVSKKPNFYTIQISEILDEEPIFKSNDIDILFWLADYYQHPIGEVFDTFCPPTLRKPVKRNIHSRNIQSEYKAFSNDKKVTLNKEQVESLEILNNLDGFDPCLLYGVTGSGKTEIYLRLTDTYLTKGKSVLILVPEISLTPQLEDRFVSRFGDNIGIYHSKKTAKQRYDIWERAQSGELKIVIGTRSAVLCPLNELGVIIVDEEHDQSYKQHEGFRFSARDLSIKRAQVEAIPIVLGTATPSLQTLRLVQEKKYKEAKLLKRANGFKPPGFITLDINDSQLESGIAKESLDAITNTLKENKQVLIFINRRGFSPLYECSSCRWTAECSSCDARLVFHHGLNRLICHRCDSAYGVPKKCPACNSSSLNLQGSGTERIELFLENYFEGTTIIRLDQDTTKKKGSLKEILEMVHKSESAILVGTQMLAKGHDFPRVELGIILNCDSGITSPDINSLEKISQLLIQVSGRVGRKENNGKVIIQTRYPEDKNLLELKSGDYLNFALNNLKQKKELRHPPYSAIALLRTTSPLAKHNINFLHQVNKSAKLKSDMSIIGPIPSIISKSRGNFRHHSIIQASSKIDLNKLIKNIIVLAGSWKETKKVKWYFDIDPIDYN
ncbi:MAG: primosomal protein N' [Gammaproteobacteria bacterium]